MGFIESIGVVFGDKSNRPMLLLIVLLLAFAVIELLYSKWANSLALVASAFFDVTDAVVLLVGVWGKTVTRNKKPTLRYSYGFERYEIIAKFGAASYFAFVCLWIFFEVGIIIKFCLLFIFDLISQCRVWSVFWRWSPPLFTEAI
jgi:Co/Zn/Cd efflux system component